MPDYIILLLLWILNNNRFHIIMRIYKYFLDNRLFKTVYDNTNPASVVVVYKILSDFQAQQICRKS